MTLRKGQKEESVNKEDYKYTDRNSFKSKI